MAEIDVVFHGQRRDLNQFGFAIFEHEIRYDFPIDVPGDAKLTLKPEVLRKAVGPGIMEVVLNLGEGFAAGLFANWVFAKWQKSGSPPSIKIEIDNRFYQFDPEVLTKALEDAAKKVKAKKPPNTASEAPPSASKTRKKSQR